MFGGKPVARGARFFVENGFKIGCQDVDGDRLNRQKKLIDQTTKSNPNPPVAAPSVKKKVVKKPSKVSVASIEPTVASQDPIKLEDSA